MIDEMSVQTLSGIKTQALCGYSFDFTEAGTERQDVTQLTAAPRKSPRKSTFGRSSIRPSSIVTGSQHEDYVYRLRDQSQVYFDLERLVTLIKLFREWREEEEYMVS